MQVFIAGHAPLDVVLAEHHTRGKIRAGAQQASAFRVVVALVDLAVEVAKPVTVEEINGALKDAADNKLKGILAYSEEELVSVDFTSSPYSSIVDAPLTQVVGRKLVKIFSWYDNESGYACRLRDLAVYIAGKF